MEDYIKEALEEKFYDKEKAGKVAKELTEKARKALIESHPLENKIYYFFENKLGSDELLCEAHLPDAKENTSFIEDELNYTLIYTKEEYDRYKVEKTGTEEVSGISGYSGTVDANGNVSLSADTYEGEIPVYGIFYRDKITETFTGYYKVLKKKDVAEVDKAEKEVWKNREKYHDIRYGKNKVSDWKKVSAGAFFFKYGIIPFVLTILMAFAALLFPKFSFSIPWISENPDFPYIWTLLRQSQIYTLSPFIALAALGFVVLLSIILLNIKSKVDYRHMYDRYMDWHDGFYWFMIIAACCVVGSFLLGLVPEVASDAEFILRMLRWIGWLLANLLWIAAFVLLIIDLCMILRNGFGVALAHKINNRINDLQDYVASGQYETDKNLVEKIKSLTVKKTAMGFEMPKIIDLNNCSETLSEKE